MPAASTYTSLSGRKNRISSVGIGQQLAQQRLDLLRRGLSGAQPLEERRHALERLVARAAEAAVDDVLQRRAQRAEGDRHDERRPGGGPGRVAAQRRSEHQRGERVRRSQQQRQRSVDERAFDRDVDVVEPVAQDRDPDGDREQAAKQTR